jgi:hypothetical protein
MFLTQFRILGIFVENIITIIITIIFVVIVIVIVVVVVETGIYAVERADLKS